MSLQNVRPFGREAQLKTRSGNFTAVIVSDPRSNLAQEVKKGVFESFYPVALSGFGRPDTSGFHQDVMNHLFNVDVLILVFDLDKDGEAAAFRTFSMPEVDCGDGSVFRVIYTEGTVVKSEYQGRGLYQAITREVVDSFPGFSFIVSRTQNPVVVTALHKLFGKVYPVTAGPDDNIRKIGSAIARRLGMSDYDAEKMICRGTYGGILTGTLPRSSNEIERKVTELISLENGDSMVIVCPLV